MQAAVRQFAQQELILLIISTPRNADVVTSGAGVTNSNNALGGILPVGTTLNSSNAARLSSLGTDLRLDLSDTIPENAIITLSIARANSTGDYDLLSSPDNVAYSNFVYFLQVPIMFRN